MGGDLSTHAFGSGGITRMKQTGRGRQHNRILDSGSEEKKEGWQGGKEEGETEEEKESNRKRREKKEKERNRKRRRKKEKEEEKEK